MVIGGGQAGLATAAALRCRGAHPVVMEAGSEPTGSWSRYYDSLRLFTPARLNSLHGSDFPADPTHYPSRDEMVSYLRNYAASLDCDIRVRTRVDAVVRHGDEFVVHTADGDVTPAHAVVSATGQFLEPHRPDIPGLRGYTGDILHVSDYRNPTEHRGARIVVVGSGNSAVQIACELVEHAEVSIASRTPIRYATSEPIPGDSRIWSVLSVAGRVPLGRLYGPGTVPVIDTMGYRAAVEAGRPDHRPLPIGAEGRLLSWADGHTEHVDLVLLATGYRPRWAHLAPLELRKDRRGRDPAHRSGISIDFPGLAFMGLENQRTFLSATVHGVTRDAAHVAARLTGHL